MSIAGAADMKKGVLFLMALLLGATVLLGAGCGKKGPPEPPDEPHIESATGAAGTTEPVK